VGHETAVLFLHQRPQDAAAAVGDRHGDPGDAGCGQDGAPGERDVERERAGDPDDPPVVLGEQEAVRLEKGPEGLDVLVAVVEAEATPVHRGDGGKILRRGAAQGGGRGVVTGRGMLQHDGGFSLPGPPVVDGFVSIRQDARGGTGAARPATSTSR
jgi:hypothetical protein